MFVEKEEDEEYWRKHAVFQLQLKYIHVVFDVCPYWTQILLTLSLAIERYILICRGSDAKTILSQKRRKTAYCLIVLMIAVLPALSVVYLAELGRLGDSTAEVCF